MLRLPAGRAPERVTKRASIEAELVHRTVEDDGGTSERYRGVLMVAGVRYRCTVSLFTGLGWRVLHHRHCELRACRVASGNRVAG
jgi:hypothetical protein